MVCIKLRSSIVEEKKKKKRLKFHWYFTDIYSNNKKCVKRFNSKQGVTFTNTCKCDQAHRRGVKNAIDNRNEKNNNEKMPRSKGIKVYMRFFMKYLYSKRSKTLESIHKFRLPHSHEKKIQQNFYFVLMHVCVFAW